MAHIKWMVVLGILMLYQACSLSDHPVGHSNLGKPSSLADMEKLIDLPGPIDVETVNSADWTVPLAGLLNLKSPAAQAAHLIDHPEPIHVFAHVLNHQTLGTYLVDTGVSQQLIDDLAGHGVSWPIRVFMPLSTMHVENGTAQILARIPGGVQGVFFTHLHVDHISGMPDVPGSVPLYVGRGESTQISLQNMVVRGTTTRLLERKAELQEWPFRLDEENKTLVIGDVVDIFGDGSAF